jgi:Sec-independent protein translocase protein TatA
MWEILVILVVALIVLGPKQLTEAAQVLGKLYRDLQKMSWEVRENFNLEKLASSSDHKEASAPDDNDRVEHPSSETGPAPTPEEKWGPDFYADLLERTIEKEDESAKEDQKEAQQDTVEHKRESKDEHRS